MKGAAIALIMSGVAIAQAYYWPAQNLPCPYADMRYCICVGGCSSPVAVTILKAWTDVPASECTGGAITASNGVSLSVTRASNKTCTDGNGVIHTLTSNQPALEASGLLVEATGTNSELDSNLLSAGAWSAPTNVSISQNVTGPDAVSNSAWTITNNSTNGAHRILQNGYPTSSAPVSASIYAMAGTASFLTISDQTHFAEFNVSTGAVLNTGGAGTTAAITALAASGWYRPAATFTTSAQANFLVFYMCETSGQCNAAAPSYAGTGKTIIVFGAQLETGGIATSYIPTASLAAARAADVIGFINPIANGARVWSAGYTMTSALAGGSSYGAPPGFEGDDANGNFSDYTLDWENSVTLGAGWYFDVFDSTGATCTGAKSLAALTANASHRIVGSINGAITTITLDGAASSNNHANCTATVTAPYQQPIVYIGSEYPSSGLSVAARSWFHDLCWATTASGCL